MLILSRKVGETVTIGETVVMRVVQIDRGKVTLGFDAPPGIPIWRFELLSRVEQEKMLYQRAPGTQPAAQSAPPVPLPSQKS